MSSSSTRTVCIVLTGRGEPGPGLMVVSCIILTLASYTDTVSSREINTVNTDDSGAAVFPQYRYCAPVLGQHDIDVRVERQRLRADEYDAKRDELRAEDEKELQEHMQAKGNTGES